MSMRRGEHGNVKREMGHMHAESLYASSQLRISFKMIGLLMRNGNIITKLRIPQNPLLHPCSSLTQNEQRSISKCTKNQIIVHLLDVFALRCDKGYFDMLLIAGNDAENFCIETDVYASAAEICFPTGVELEKVEWGQVKVMGAHVFEYWKDYHRWIVGDERSGVWRVPCCDVRMHICGENGMAYTFRRLGRLAGLRRQR